MSDNEHWYCRVCKNEIDDDFFCSKRCEMIERDDWEQWTERAMSHAEWIEEKKKADDEFNQARKDGLFK